jgi:hypothetical protein
MTAAQGHQPEHGARHGEDQGAADRPAERDEQAGERDQDQAEHEPHGFLQVDRMARTTTVIAQVIRNAAFQMACRRCAARCLRWQVWQ